MVVDMTLNDFINFFINSFYAKVLILIVFVFYVIKLIKNLNKKVKEENLAEGLENLDETDKLEKNLTEMNNVNNDKKSIPIPQPSNAKIVNQYANPHTIGIARRSGEFNNKLFNKLEDDTNRLLMKDYGNNYMQILDRFDYLLSLKMLDNTLTVDFNDEKQMLSKIEKINKYGETKKLIDEMKDIVAVEST